MPHSTPQREKLITEEILKIGITSSIMSVGTQYIALAVKIVKSDRIIGIPNSNQKREVVKFSFVCVGLGHFYAT